MSYDSLTNRGDYLSPHYLAEVLPRELSKKGGLRTRWAERDKAGEPTPVKGLRGLRREYFTLRPGFAEFARRLDEGDAVTEDERRNHDKSLQEQNGALLRALGFVAAPRLLEVERAGEIFPVLVAYAEQNVVAVDCGWAADTDAALDADQAGRLLTPVEMGNREKIETGAKLARWLSASDDPPRYVLLLHGGVVILADRATWADGRYLAVSLDTAIERGDPAELETIVALFSADALQLPAEGGNEQLAEWVAGSRQHAVGVSSELREGLCESVQIIANEVLARLREHGVQPEQISERGELAKELGREALRYLYRILFLLYAEARPELGILPVDDEDYIAGYSMQRLGEVVTRRLIGEEARRSFHLYESLDLLFRMVNQGHRARGTASTQGLSEGEGLRFEALKADLFEPKKTRLIGWIDDPRHDEAVGGEAPQLDTRLRDEALYKVLRRLMLAKGGGRGRGGRAGRTERGGFISYAQLGISQLGAVYEGLMSYTGFIADEELYEVAKNADPSGGSWMIPASKVPSYPDDVFVMEKDDNGFTTGERVRYRPGSFIYRLAGRDRQTSASYYTPVSLTSVTVELALKQRIKEEGRDVTAAEVLRWRVCEPALGSGAFLNEAIDQLAALYLRLREEEADDRLEPDERALALQKVKAYIALHNCYGVDLNETAVELAEVSIWLNVMHRGLQAPWFGLHLVRGNSLIGAGRRLYPPEKLAKSEWLKSAPKDHPFSSGKIPEGHIHHFLLPAEGWGAVAGEKEARELAPDEAKQLAAWRKQIRKPPSDKRARSRKLSQVQRLQDLASRAEYLWNLVIERLRISEREISRAIDVWGATDLPRAQEAIPRDKILADLTTPGTPYWRLKTLMDAWCALWFWPVDKVGMIDGSDEVYQQSATVAENPVTLAPKPTGSSLGWPVTWRKASLFDDEPEQLTIAEVTPQTARKTRPKQQSVIRRSPVPLKDFEDWLEFAEALLGRQDIPENSLAAHLTSLEALEEYEEKLDSEFYMNMDPVYRLGERFPWLDTIEDIARQQGFFHWELRFAQVLADGGFDVQVGNPPWVRPEWDESAILAELDPWFELADRLSASERKSRKAKVLGDHRAVIFVLDELVSQATMSEFLSSVCTYPLLAGTRPDFYRGFMCRTWSNLRRTGTIGLMHPDSHFGGIKEASLRAAAYRHLRIHGSFVNAANWAFEDLGRTLEFGIHIYGRPQEISFLHLSQLYGAAVLPESLTHDGSGRVPGQKYMGTWDQRPHADRVVRVNAALLRDWNQLSDDPHAPEDKSPLLYPITLHEEAAIMALAAARENQGPPDLLGTSSGYNETNAQRDQLVRWEAARPNVLEEVILQGTHISVATPYAKEPNEPFRNNKDWVRWNLNNLPEAAIPRTTYVRACGQPAYEAAQDKWGNIAYTKYYRMAWRVMIDPKSTERSLFAALLPPGPAHVDAVMSAAAHNNKETALNVGFWSSLPLDYLLRITGRTHLRVAEIKKMPKPSPQHPLATALLLRVLRLNCLTSAYEPLWAELYDQNWIADEEWAAQWPRLAALVNPAVVSRQWNYSTPLRTERERRSAMVEIDSLVAVWLGISTDQLTAIYRSRYPILADREEHIWFDSEGRRIAADPYAFGYGQTKEQWEQFQKYVENAEKNVPPDGYKPPFYKADRIAEYRQAHAAFSERLRRAREESDVR